MHGGNEGRAQGTMRRVSRDPAAQTCLAGAAPAGRRLFVCGERAARGAHPPRAGRRLLLLADGPVSREYWESLKAGKLPRTVEVVGRVHLEEGGECGGHWDLARLGALEELPELTHRMRVDEIVVASPEPLERRAAALLERCARQGVRVAGPVSAHEELTRRTPLFGEQGYRLDTHSRLEGWYGGVLKRALDVVLTLLMLPAALPLMGLAALGILLSDGRPVLYEQERVGQGGQRFRILKLRTMVRDAEQRTGPVWALKNDPRVTPLGRSLRLTHLDELPQLFNVLRGEMSLVGPRPERPVFVERFTQEVPWYARRLLVRPGLTGWAQVRHHYDCDLEDVREKVRLDLYYLRHLSLGLDLHILLTTVGVMLRRRGAH